jgi:hypothetical protein
VEAPVAPANGDSEIGGEEFKSRQSMALTNSWVSSPYKTFGWLAGSQLLRQHV